MKAHVRMLVVAVAAAGLVVPFGPATDAAETEIYGFSMTSAATAVSMIYDQPSFGLPAEHTFELRKVHSVAQVDSGPSGRGFASVLWPGDVVGNAPLGLAIDIFVQDPTSARYIQCSGDDPLQTSGHTCVPVLDSFQNLYGVFKDDYKRYAGEDFNPPPYPIRAEAFYPQGPKDGEYPAGGGILMRAHSEQTLSSGESTTQKAGFPGALSIGTMNSSAQTAVVDGKAVSEAHALVGQIDFIGQLYIDSVTTVQRAISDGAKAKLEGSVVVSGMKIFGQSVTVDGTGFHAGGQNRDPLGQEAASLLKQLAGQGITLAVAEPIDIRNGAEASRAIPGLIVTLNSTGMQKVVNAMPPEYRGWLNDPTSSPLSPLFEQFSSTVQGFVASPFQFDQTLSFVFGSAFVSSAASPTFDVVVPPLPDLPPPVIPVSSGGGGAGVPLPGAPPPAGTPPAQRPLLRAEPVGVLGVPTGLGVGALFAVALAAFFLRRLAERAVAAEAAESCPLESP